MNGSKASRKPTSGDRSTKDSSVQLRSRQRTRLLRNESSLRADPQPVLCLSAYVIRPLAPLFMFAERRTCFCGLTLAERGSISARHIIRSKPPSFSPLRGFAENHREHDAHRKTELSREGSLLTRSILTTSLDIVWVRREETPDSREILTNN